MAAPRNLLLHHCGARAQPPPRRRLGIHLPHRFDNNENAQLLCGVRCVHERGDLADCYFLLFRSGVREDGVGRSDRYLFCEVAWEEHARPLLWAYGE